MKTFNVSQVARVLQRSRTSAKNLIETGQITAFDAAPDGRKRQWRVTEDSLNTFMAKNAAKPAAKRKRPVPKPTRQWV